MATMTMSDAVRSDLATSFIANVDGGAGAATLKFYTGTQPADPDVAIGAQVLLGTLTCSDPCGTETDGVLTFSSITQDSAADATGTATWARLADSNGVAVADFDVTNTVGTGAIKLNTTSIVTGGPIAVSSFVITFA